jgi:F-type H+-transporting ATPase subunit a
MLLLIGFGLAANRSLAAAKVSGSELVPDGSLTIRNLAELLVNGISGLAEGVIGHRAKPYIGLFGTFFIFILTSNALGLVPGFAPPTSNFNITFALGVGSFLAFNYIGIRDQGLGSYLAHFAGPIWWLAVLMLPLELIGVFVRPVSLGLRLFGNMTGDHLVLEIFTDLTKVLVPVIFYFFGTLVSVLQAFVFTLLTIIYVSLSMGHGHDHH